MLDRIKQILEDEGLQSSSFADKIGVSRGTISHILNGRNDPSKDTIDKILKAFPDISPAWLWSGTGQTYNIHERIQIKSAASSGQLGLFDENQTVESTVQPDESKYSQKNEVKMPENIPNQTEIQSINLQNITSKKVDKIVFFFNDNTFKVYMPEELV